MLVQMSSRSARGASPGDLWSPEQSLPRACSRCYSQIYNSPSDLLGKYQPPPAATSRVKRCRLGGWLVLHVTGVLRWTSHLSHPCGCRGRNPLAAAEVSGAFGGALWFGVSPSPSRRAMLSAVSRHVTSCRAGSGRGTPVGDWGQPTAADALLRRCQDHVRGLQEGIQHLR